MATLLEKLEFQRLVEETLSVKRVTRVMSLYPFVLAMVLALYGGFGGSILCGSCNETRCG